MEILAWIFISVFLVTFIKSIILKGMHLKDILGIPLKDTLLVCLFVAILMTLLIGLPICGVLYILGV